MVSNLEEITLYFVGTVILFSKRNDEAFEILRQVLNKYLAKNIKSIEDNIAIRNLISFLDKIYADRAMELELYPCCKKKEENILKAGALIQDFQGIVSFELHNLLIESQIKFAEGNLSKSKSVLKDIYNRDKTSSAGCFSLAFLYYYEGDIVKGWDCLKLALSKKHTARLSQESVIIARWYEEALKEDRTKDYLNFPLAIIYYELVGDFKDAEESFNYVVKKYKNSSEKICKTMVWISEKYLKKIKRKGEK